MYLEERTSLSITFSISEIIFNLFVVFGNTNHNYLGEKVAQGIYGQTDKRKLHNEELNTL
jgi:hypothetical protein